MVIKLMFFWLDNVDVLSGVVCTRRVLVGVIVGRSTTEFIVGLCEKGETCAASC